MSEEKIDIGKINIGKIVPISTVDWHGRSVCTIFFNGCPFRCSYCQNHKLLDCKKFMKVEDVEKRILDSEPFISAVVFSGGEPTMQGLGLIKLAEFIKRRGLAVGVQTNGYYPDVLGELVRRRLVDKIFLDIKANPLLSDRYSNVTGFDAIILERIIKSVNIPDVIIEVRTTIFRYLNDSIDVAKYLEDNNGDHIYVIQQGLPWNTLDKEIRKEDILTVEEMKMNAEKIRRILKRDMIIKIRTREKGEENII